MPLRRTASIFGCWSSVIATIFSILFVALAAAFIPPPWTNIQAYAAGFDSKQMASFVPVFLLAPTVIVLMVSLHFSVDGDRKIFTLLGLAFSVIYTTIVSTNYFLQLFVVRLNLINGDLEGLALLSMPNLHSAFFALEGIGYFFLSLATLFASPVFSNGRIEAWIRWLFIANGLLGILGLIIVPFDKPSLVFASIGLWSVIFPLSTILLSIYFKRRM